MENREKIRLDILVSEKGEVSRTIAKDFIEEGLVSVSGREILSPGAKFAPDADIAIQKPEDIFVSRAGYKLKSAIDAYGIVANGRICLDVGASTGGFTQCLLKYGAEKVYAVDTGTAQLNEELMMNPKVVSMEKTNVNSVESLPDDPDLAVVDVSFVSLKKVFKSILLLTGSGAEIVCLIKPQFEAGREHINKKGIVNNRKVHLNLLINFYDYFQNQGVAVRGLMASPVKGGDGNREYLVYLSKNTKEKSMGRFEFASLAEEAVKV